ncbi:hypothetical protein [Rossellomorea marisflavi]|nr:hypothetical protein [Rossellomorea marisflavi]
MDGVDDKNSPPKKVGNKISKVESKSLKVDRKNSKVGRKIGKKLAYGK